MKKRVFATAASGALNKRLADNIVVVVVGLTVLLSV